MGFQNDINSECGCGVLVLYMPFQLDERVVASYVSGKKQKYPEHIFFQSFPPPQEVFTFYSGIHFLLHFFPLFL